MKENTNSSNSKRKLWIDAVKGIGIILVMLSHCIQGDGWSKYTTPCFISLFFVIAGYTYKHKGSFRDFILNKAQRLMLPYAIYSAILFAFFVLTALFFSQPIHLWYGAVFGVFYGRISLVMCNGPLWFLPAMFLGYLFFRILETSSNKVKCFLIPLYFLLPILAIHVPALLTMLARQLHVEHFMSEKLHLALPWSIDVGAFAAVCMYVGYMVKQHKPAFHRYYQFPLFFVALLSYGILVDYNGSVGLSISRYGSRDYLSPITCFFIGVLGTYLYAQLCIWTENLYITKTLAHVGKMSLTLMCTHRLLFAGLDFVFREPLALENRWLIGCGWIVSAVIFAELWLILCRFLSAKINVFRYL